MIGRPACPVRGHDGHPLDVVTEHVQDGTGHRATVVTCTRNGWRWFLVAGMTPGPTNRMVDRRRR